MAYLYILAGALIGAPARYFVQSHVQEAAGTLFPIGTLVVNASGCLVIGLLAGVSEEYGVLTRDQRMFLFIGVLGSYTTFSSFGLDSVQLLREGQALQAWMNVTASITLGLAAVWAGLLVVQWVSSRG